MRVAGSPIGTRDLETVMFAGKTKLLSISTLGKKAPHAAHRLLTSCATTLFSYLSATTPPDLLLPHLLRYDEAVECTFLRILEFDEPNCSVQRLTRARQVYPPQSDAASSRQ